MRYLAIALVAFSLSGCATYKNLTQNYDNPISPQTLYNLENAGVVIFAGLNAYKHACAQTADETCRIVVARVQSQTRKLPPLLRSLRSFVKNNDQVNAKIVYSTLVIIINDIKAVAAANNVKVQ